MDNQGIKVESTGKEFQEQLGGIVRFLSDTGDPNENRQPLEDWVEYMETRTDLLFATGSRDGVRWARLSDSTKAGRRFRGVGHMRPLDVTGALRKSIHGEVVQSLYGIMARIKSDDPKARSHHGGANLPARTVVPKNATVLRFPRADGTVVFARKANIPAATIPARPILFISERDNQTGVRYVREHRLRLVKRALKNAHKGVPVGIPRGEVLA